MKSNVLALAALSVLFLSACKPAADAPAVDDTVETAATEAAADAIDAGTGVAECDQYLEKVYACIRDKVPAAQREMMEQGIEQSKAGWSAVADKAELANQCKAAMDQARTAYTAMGCAF